METFLDNIVSTQYIGNYNNINSFHMTEENKIIDFATSQFIENGSFKTTMDQLAKGLKISKKTIYKFFPSKSLLMEKVITLFQDNIKIKLFKIVESDKSIIEKMILVGSFFVKFSLKMNKTKILDFLQKEPALWQQIDEFRTHVIEHVWEILILEGKKEGLIINKNDKIILTIILSSLRGVINPHFLTKNKISITQAFEESFAIIINGILTEKGKKEFEKQEWEIK